MMSHRFTKSLGFFFFAYGIYSVFAMQRDFQHAKQLTLVLLALIPAFLGMVWIDKIYSRQESQGLSSPRLKAAHWISKWLSQSIAQYILMFCLPFFLVSHRWVYLFITGILLLTTLWESWWNLLRALPLYRQVLRTWSILCASSFLMPFFWPQRLLDFYLVLACISVLTLLPTRWEPRYFKFSGLLIGIDLIILLLLPINWRFPILSVWLHEPHFATNVNSRERGVSHFSSKLDRNELQDLLIQGSSLCCVAPVIAPPGVRERVTQEWLVNDRLIERSELKSHIQGNDKQRAYHSYFCKHNFPAVSDIHSLRCRLSLQDKIFFGEVQLKITHK